MPTIRQAPGHDEGRARPSPAFVDLVLSATSLRLERALLPCAGDQQRPDRVRDADVRVLGVRERRGRAEGAGPALQDIADDNGGTRAVGTAGYDESVDYVSG